jgi:hypothetical protein
MHSRRNFIGKVASGLAGSLATTAPILGANDRIRLGIIGPGARGLTLMREAMACPNTEMVACADVYTRRLEEAKKVAPDIKTYMDYRHLLDDLPSTPCSSPRRSTCTASISLPRSDAGKHFYQEKTMAFSVDHAKRMRARLPEGPRSAPCRSVTRVAPRGSCATPLFWARGRRGEGDRGAFAHVPKHPARQAAVVAAGLPGHDAGKQPLEVVPRRKRPKGLSTPTATSTGASSGTTRAATCTRTCRTSSRFGIRS